MTDLSQLSDEELMGLYRRKPDVASMVTAEAQRQGVDPDLALRLARQESGLRTGAVSPKGARGPMQLMPGTARDLGVNPDDPEQNIRGGVTYLKRQLDTFGDPKLALAAYNAGPGAVRKYGGVPPYAETQGYVKAIAGDGGSDLAGMSNEELQALYAQSAPQDAPMTGSSQNGGVTVQVGPAPKLPAAKPSILRDAASGFSEPFVNLGHDVAESYRGTKARAKAPPTPGDMFSGIGDIPRIASDLAAATGAPLQAAIRPLAGVLSRALPTPNATHTEWRGLIPHKYVDGKMTPEQAQASLEGDINAALQGARPSGVNLPAARAASLQSTPVPGKNLTQQTRALAPQMPVGPGKPRAISLPELKRADDAAWAKVDASGYRFPKKDLQAVARDVRQMVDEADPDLYPEAAKIAAKLERMSARGDLTPAQANRLRSQIGEKLLQPGSTEVSVGGQIKARIDTLIDTANDPSLAQARALHTRYLKTREVTQRLEDAGVNQASTGNGGNLNAARQALKPLVKNKSTQRMRNATPDEMKALKRVTNGSPGQNLLRAASAFDPFHSKLGTLLQTALGVKTGGLSAATIPLGMAATAGERALAQRNIDALLTLLSNGGKTAKAATVTPRGLIGSGVLTAPLARQAAPRPSKTK